MKKVDLNDATRIAIDTYLLVRKKTNCPNLFVSNNGKPMATNSIDRTINKLALRAGITDKKISAHSLRRTVATDMYKRGEDILTIKNVLGHHKISTTELYIKDTNEFVKKAINSRVIGMNKVSQLVGKEKRCVTK